MMDNKNRKKIPKTIKDAVYNRQNGLCACCVNRAKELHHVVAFSLLDEEIFRCKNFIYLCEEHHTLFHVGDPETIQTVYEYAWFLENGKMPEEKDLVDIAKEVYGNIKNEKD